MWPDNRSRSHALYERALHVMPGGITRGLPWQDPFPIYAASGDGAYITDVDGVRRLDLLNNFASLIHGHAPAAVVSAVREQVSQMTALAMPTEAEIDLAEEICRRAESMEWVRFCNSGSEAVMNAIKAARAVTGRPKIAKVEGAYHGSYDYAEVSLDPSPSSWGNDPRSVGYAKGTPRSVTEDVVVLPFNDVEASERIIRANRDALAAVLIDPAPSYFGFVPISDAYAQMIRRITREIGALFVLDEVISFRIHEGGAQTLFGIDPDLTVLGKIVGGGFPVGAVAGRRKYMGVFDHRNGRPDLPASGTFTANPVTMTAGRVTLQTYRQPDVDRLDELGRRLREGVSRAFRDNDFPGQITGLSSMFMILGHRREVRDYRTAYSSDKELRLVQALQKKLVIEGYHIARTGKGFASTPANEDDIDGFIKAVETITSKEFC